MHVIIVLHSLITQLKKEIDVQFRLHTEMIYIFDPHQKSHARVKLNQGHNLIRERSLVTS